MRYWWVVATLALSGCAETPGRPAHTLAAFTPERAQLDIPFFPDTTDQCGPSTVASLLAYWNKPVPLKTLRDEMYVAKLHGSLPMDLLLTAKNHGLAASMVRGDISQVRNEILAKRPVIAMLNLGFTAIPIDHYVVVTGFDEKRGGFLAHSSGHANRFISYKRFMDAWEKTDYWTLEARLP